MSSTREETKMTDTELDRAVLATPDPESKSNNLLAGSPVSVHFQSAEGRTNPPKGGE